MVHLNEVEKQEMLKVSQSMQLKQDFRRLRENRGKYSDTQNIGTIDEYIEFLNFANAFANHAVKPFKKIDGKNFIL